MDEKERENLKKYLEHLKEESKKFILTSEDLGNLFDLSSMIGNDVYETLKLNNMDKWFDNFFQKIEKIILPELYDK